MSVREYYQHARSLGAFRAVDCLRVARDAAAAEWAASMRLAANRGPSAASWERIGNEQPIKLSFSIKVY